MRMNLSVERLILLHAALKGLEGYEKIIKDGSNEKAVKGYFELDGQKVRLRAAMNLNALQPVSDGYARARNEVFSQMANGESELKDPKIAMAFNAEDRRMLDDLREVDLQRIDYADLKLDKNTAIGGTILAGLAPILIRVPELSDEGEAAVAD